MVIPQEEVFCDEFHLVDLRVYENCKTVVKGCDHVFNLAADMGGECAVHHRCLGSLCAACMPQQVLLSHLTPSFSIRFPEISFSEACGATAGMGFIQSNHSVIMYNNTMISFNMMEVSRIEGIKRRAALLTTQPAPKFLPSTRPDLRPRYWLFAQCSSFHGLEVLKQGSVLQ